VRTFGSADTPLTISDGQQRDAVHRVDSDVAGVDFHVKIVKEIRFCRPGSGSFNGCAFPTRFRSIIVIPPEDGLPSEILWAHEFGHLTGLPHRNSSCALMTCFSVRALDRDTRVRVNRKECGCLLGGPGSCGKPPRFDCAPAASCE